MNPRINLAETSATSVRIWFYRTIVAAWLLIGLFPKNGSALPSHSVPLCCSGIAVVITSSLPISGIGWRHLCRGAFLLAVITSYASAAERLIPLSVNNSAVVTLTPAKLVLAIGSILALFADHTPRPALAGFPSLWGAFFVAILLVALLSGGAVLIRMFYPVDVPTPLYNLIVRMVENTVLLLMSVGVTQSLGVTFGEIRFVGVIIALIGVAHWVTSTMI